ncbi:uncharacterized protein [Clytia hemisphaerica]|uniref:Uncharacterized protein n=1 Tax=Clytia hemisphaerica TaxID=252671 RepID=A0A7M5XGR8_9CNID
METWLIAVIAVGGTVSLAILILCICKCCCRDKNSKTFRWIERLGIPQAKEGTPTDEELSKEMKVHVTYDGKSHVTNGTLNRTNRSYDDDDDDVIIEAPQAQRKISEFEEPEPFKRLDHLGIPRAQIGASPTNGRRAPSSPLPSPIPEDDDLVSSSDEEVSVRQ